MTIELERRRQAHVVPSYSLTGDLLSFRRCARQYRYYNGSALPPSRPVQMWYGEFVHGVMEATFRYWKATRKAPPFPWPCTMRPYRDAEPNWDDHDIGQFADKVERSLAAQGKTARSRDTRESAYERVRIAVNILGPSLFPLISSAEEKVIGTRSIKFSTPLSDARSAIYEVHGVVDVISHIELSTVPATNVIRQAIESAVKNLPDEFEVIVDYKGARRPDTDEAYWEEQDWQVQTYAWLRHAQRTGRPVAAAVLVYVNELSPGSSDIGDLQRAAKKGKTDVVPLPGSDDERRLSLWRPGLDANFSLDFRLRRALRVISITPSTRDTAALRFDEVVGDIETLIDAESHQPSIEKHWKGNCQQEATCVACDFRHSCQTPAGSTKKGGPDAPAAP